MTWYGKVLIIALCLALLLHCIGGIIIIEGTVAEKIIICTKLYLVSERATRCTKKLMDVKCLGVSLVSLHGWLSNAGLVHFHFSPNTDLKAGICFNSVSLSPIIILPLPYVLVVFA